MLRLRGLRDKRLLGKDLGVAFNIFLVICLFMGMSVKILADNKDKESGKVNYVDSLRHNNTVYSENETRNLVRYLAALKETSPVDSMRRYATEGLMNFTWYLMNQGEWFLCSDLLKNAERYCPSEDRALMHQIETAVAGVNLYNENYNEAGRLLLAANKYFLENSDTVEWLKNCVNLGLYYSRIHNRPKALEYYMKVLSIAQKEKKYENYYSIVSGYAERVEEDSIIGLSILEKALRISIDNGYTFLLASNYNELARYYYRMENYHEALSNARKALNYAERFSQDAMQTTACGILADIYYIQKNYVAAYGMLARKNSIREKLQENLVRKYYAHLNEIDSLISWISVNVPLSDPIREDVNPKMGVPHNNYVWLWMMLGGIVIAGIGILIGMRIKNRTVAARDEKNINVDDNDSTTDDSKWEEQENKGENMKPENGNQVVAISDNELAPDTPLNADQLRQAAALSIVAESFNPMLDRIRNMVKEIPKTGDSAVDSQVRSLMNYLLQTRLPESDNEIGKAVKLEEGKFMERLSSTYPGLTKNDLRMALYIKCGLSLQEISAISGLQPKSVNQARYRLRKSLGLGQEDSLEGFIAAF